MYAVLLRTYGYNFERDTIASYYETWWYHTLFHGLLASALVRLFDPAGSGHAVATTTGWPNY